MAKAEFPAELAHVAHDLIKFTIKARYVVVDLLSFRTSIDIHFPTSRLLSLSINGAQGHAVRLSPSAWAPVVSRMQRGELIDIVVLSSPAPDAEPRIHSRFELEMMREAAFAELIPPPPPYYRNDQRSDDWTARAGLGRRLGGTRTQKESQRLWNGMF